MSPWWMLEDDENDADELDELMPPVDLSGIREIDLIGCPRCGVVFSIADHGHVQHRAVTRTRGKASWELREKAGDDTVSGIFCPSCGQRVFDQETWIEHLADRRVFDRQHGPPPHEQRPTPEPAPEAKADPAPNVDPDADEAVQEDDQEHDQEARDVA